MATLMDRDERMEQMSLAYIKAVASAAGFAVARPNVDDDSIDLMVSSREEGRPRIELQAKASALPLGIAGDHFPFRLKRKNYDELRIENILVPRYLFVVVMPHDYTRWIEVIPDDETSLLQCAGYWVSIKGSPSRDQQWITVQVPRDNLLTPEGLAALMHRVGEEPLP